MSASLWDWRRRVADLYAAVRAESDPHAAWQLWRHGRDTLYRTHDQTPLEHPERFTALPFYAYDPALRFIVTLDPAEGPVLALPAGADGEV